MAHEARNSTRITRLKARFKSTVAGALLLLLAPGAARGQEALPNLDIGAAPASAPQLPKAPTTVNLEKAMDDAREQITPPLGATVYTHDKEQIDSHPS